ncbi:MAG: toluene tolerance protein [Micavibrio aeruginosavorus]|uniref:Toluene tolerance protein n=1 Tax=Micavibrio aeruginosavorus TaxID=349221 RepID=A0A2W5HJ80_9BACT|nr:MAG: toluene tolerance protein [Micavibrio aeruginosavorus]
MLNFPSKTICLITTLTLLSGTMLAGQAQATASAADAPSGVSYTEASASQAGAMERGAFDFVKTTTDKGLKFLSDANASKEKKTADFRKLLDESFDLDTIGKFALGRYAKTATPQQLSEYSKLFRKMVVDVYSNRFEEYKGQKMEVRSFRSIGNADTLVSSFLVPPNGGEEVQVDWRVRNKGGSYKVVDVLVAGVSMSVTQRSEFSSVIQRGGGNVDALITQLKSGKAPVAQPAKK